MVQRAMARQERNIQKRMGAALTTRLIAEIYGIFVFFLFGFVFFQPTTIEPTHRAYTELGYLQTRLKEARIAGQREDLLRCHKSSIAPQ